MGCDIQAIVEVKSGGTWKAVNTNWTDNRNYGVFGFLADVRNYSHVPPISEPKGLPSDCDEITREEFDGDLYYHSITWLSLAELQSHNYSKTFWDRRITKQTGPNSFCGSAIAEVGEGQHVTLREFLPQWFFDAIAELESIGKPDDVRVVMGFRS